MGRIISAELISCKHFSGPAEAAGPHWDPFGFAADVQPENGGFRLQTVAEIMSNFVRGGGFQDSVKVMSLTAVRNDVTMVQGWVRVRGTL